MSGQQETVLPTSLEALKAQVAVRMAARQARATERVAEALAAENPAMRLSDVMFDAAEDGFEQPAEGGGTYRPDHGFDLDDLAPVLVLLLDNAAGSARERPGSAEPTEHPVNPFGVGEPT